MFNGDKLAEFTIFSDTYIIIP